MSTEAQERVKFDPKPTGTSNWKLRISYLAKSLRFRTVPLFIVSLSAYLVAYNVGVRWWKGPDHPVNRLQWQLMKANGTLPREMQEKEDVIKAYYKSKFTSSTDSFPQVR